MEPSPQPKPPCKIFRRILIALGAIIVVFGGWVGLTLAGYIPNYFDVSLFCGISERVTCIDTHFLPGGGRSSGRGDVFAKPVIYLYSPVVQDIQVQLAFEGDIIASDPLFDETLGGWRVTAYPDGRLINHTDGKEYPHLFWEGVPSMPVDWDLSKGFVVKGEETEVFLRRTLTDAGLSRQESEEFIGYWLPRMQHNAYNLIHFATTQYTETAALAITPPPDSILRIFMVFQPLAAPVTITPQHFPSFERTGFTVVEWGGTELE